MNRKGKIVCRVKENNPSIENVWWEDQFGNKMLGATLVKERSTQILSLEVTYDEWSQRIQRYCCVEHEDWMQPRKEIYERDIGKKSSHCSIKACI